MLPFAPLAPYLKTIMERAYPASIQEDGSNSSTVFLLPYGAFDHRRLFPLLEGPVNGIYYRIERPDEGVMLFAPDANKVALWATASPERWLGFDPRNQIVYEDWSGTFEEGTPGDDLLAQHGLKRGQRVSITAPNGKVLPGTITSFWWVGKNEDVPGVAVQMDPGHWPRKRGRGTSWGPEDHMYFPIDRLDPVYRGPKGRGESVNERITIGGEESKSQGAFGREFDKKFKVALDLLGFSYDVPGASAGGGDWSEPVWDIKPVGAGWHRLISDRTTNLKIATTRSLWTSVPLYDAIRNLVAAADHEQITRDEAERRMLRVVKSHLRQSGALETAFLKVKTNDIAKKIIRAVDRKDKAALRNLLVRDNFASKRIGSAALSTVRVIMGDWDKDDADALVDDGESRRTAIHKAVSWQGNFGIKLEGGTDGKKIGVTAQVSNKGGVYTILFRDRTDTPAKPYHQARMGESVMERQAFSRSNIRRERKPGEGPTSVYGSYRFHKGTNKTRKPRKDVQRSIQNRLNARQGSGKKIRNLKKWHRSHQGAEMHRQLGRYNRQNNQRSEMREKIADVRERIARWEHDLATKGYVGESALGVNQYRQGWMPTQDNDKTLDDIFEGLLRKLIVMEAIDILQDVEFDDDNGSLYLFFDPSIPGEEMDEVAQALQAEQSEIALIATPDRSLPGETVDSAWWVMFLPGKVGEDGAPSQPDPQVYSDEQEQGSKVQMVQTGPPTSVEQLAQGIDVSKILKSVGGK